MADGVDSYHRVSDILIAALETIGDAGIGRVEMLPAAVDWLTSIALLGGGEAGARAVISRIEELIEEWKSEAGREARRH